MTLMSEDPPIETARERATRIWRNHYIQHHYTIIDDTSDPNWKKIVEQDKRLNSIRSKISRMILTVLLGKNDKAITYYRLALEARHRRLLKEKLKRIRNNANE